MQRAFAFVLSSLCLIGCSKTDAADSVPTVAEPAGKESPEGAAKEEPVAGIKVGNVAPDFAVEDEAGNTVKLSQHRGKQAVLLAFYPKDFTGGCTAELTEFGDKHEMFTSKNVQVYGVSVDGQESHRKFRESLSLPFPLLADEDGALSTQYDSVMEHEGQKYAARKLVLIDTNGVVVYRDDEYQIDAADFDALIASVNAL